MRPVKQELIARATPNALPDGVEWNSQRDLLLKVHDLGLEIRPKIQDIKVQATKIAAYLAMGYYDIRQNPKLSSRFDELVRHIKGNDPVRKYVRFALQEALAGEWTAFKGYTDAIVAAVHVVVKDYAFEAGVSPTYETVKMFINRRTWGGTDQRGLDACWCQFMDMQRAESQRRREAQEEKDRVWARHLEKEREAKEIAEAEARGMTLAEFRAARDIEEREQAEMAYAEKVDAIKSMLISNGHTAILTDLKPKTLFISDGQGKLLELRNQDVDDILSCKASLL